MGALASSFSGLSSTVGKALGHLPGMGTVAKIASKGVPGFVSKGTGLADITKGIQQTTGAKQQQGAPQPPGVPPAMQQLMQGGQPGQPGSPGSPAQGQGGAPVVPGTQSLAMTPQTAMGGVAPTPPGQQFPRKLLGQQGAPGGPGFPAPLA